MTSAVARAQGAAPPLPAAIGGVATPSDEVSSATWRWAHRSLPAYLLAHSVRSYCWGAVIAAGEGWTFDRQVLWVAALMHDVGLARISRNSACFEIEGAAIARRFLLGAGMDPAATGRAAAAIVLHMRPGVTLDDGVESVLLDRATSVDVRGEGYELIRDVRPAIMAALPRGDFDRHFLRAIEREVALRPGCQSTRLLRKSDLAGWMARSPWRTTARP